ncbi:MAG: 3-dehydroquinate synthase [Planctomycetaceae bacterium]|jgi:3-dehydroquinate synthase|nr:3-dehydroquinate synthase [Planctomycetaceae bacterium]
MTLQTVPVPLGEKSYHIEIGSDNLEHIGEVLETFAPVSSAVILTDRNVQQLGYAQRVAENVSLRGIDTNILSIEAGEQSKTVETANALWNALLEDGTDRRSVLLAVGGGVVGDIGGFVAATFARGIRFFQVPTTLLAQVDSSVGGKVGLDLPNAKNMVGAFHQPLGVLVDTQTLATLPDEQFLSGLGEVAKYAVSLDADLFQFLEQNTESVNKREPETLQKIVVACCKLKAGIVAEDEFDTKGHRVLLNYGHTFGHVFEIMSKFTLLHGLAVAAGSIHAAKLALKLGLIDETLLNRHLALFKALRLPTVLDTEIDWEQAAEIMQYDKKTEFGKLCLVLPTGPGQCQLIDDIGTKLVAES